MRGVDRKDPVAKPSRKQPYKRPALTTHGDLKALTTTKGGNRMDGSGKPMTRVAFTGFG